MSWSGLILIIVGALLLANNFGLVQWAWIAQWWPMALIALGAWSLLRPARGDRLPSRGDERRP